MKAASVEIVVTPSLKKLTSRSEKKSRRETGDCRKPFLRSPARLQNAGQVEYACCRQICFRGGPRSIGLAEKRRIFPRGKIRLFQTFRDAKIERPGGLPAGKGWTPTWSTIFTTIVKGASLEARKVSDRIASPRRARAWGSLRSQGIDRAWRVLRVLRSSPRSARRPSSTSSSLADPPFAPPSTTTTTTQVSQTTRLRTKD